MFDPLNQDKWILHKLNENAFKTNLIKEKLKFRGFFFISCMIFNFECTLPMFFSNSLNIDVIIFYQNVYEFVL